MTTAEYVCLPIISAVGLVCNAVSFSYFIRTRKELSNRLLAYLSITDMAVSLAVFLYLLTPAFQNFVMGAVLKTFSTHVFRSSILVTGLITIYLNILRTSVIIWPMVRFRKRPIIASLIFFMAVFVGIEALLGVFCTYPWILYLSEKETGAEASLPYSLDDPLFKFYFLAAPIFGTPIILLVTVCCLVSTVTLLRANETLHEVEDNPVRRKAAITVLILGFLYVVCNTIWLTLTCECADYVNSSPQGSTAEYQKHEQFCTFSTLALIVNSALNPIVYICRVKKLQEHFVNIARCFCLKRREE